MIFYDFMIFVCNFFGISREVYEKKISDLPLVKAYHLVDKFIAPRGPVVVVVVVVCKWCNLV